MSTYLNDTYLSSTLLIKIETKTSTKCSNTVFESYPLVAPIPNVWSKRKSSKAKPPVSLGPTGLFAPPNLPSRCKWAADYVGPNPHTKDSV